MSIFDAQAGRSRLCRRMCKTCVFEPGNRMHLQPGRLRDLVESARATTPEGLDGTYIICHKTLPYSGTGAPPAVCRGFFDRYDTQTLQLIGRLFGWLEVEPPDHIGGVMPAPPTEENLYTSKHAARLLGVSINTLHRWDDAGRLPAVRLPNNHRRFRQYDIDAIRAGRPLPTRDADGRVVIESPSGPSETAVDGLTPGRGE